MEDKRRPFPLVADNEPVMQAPRQMQLYENTDLITHIRGDYQDKVYQDKGQVAPSRPVEASKPSLHQPKPLAPKRELSKAREEAKRDIRQKRQAVLDQQPVPSLRRSQATVKPVSKPKTSELSQFGKKLEQETYILAELPMVYTQPQNPSSQTVKKNSYDFLKKSQIYNQHERQSQKERQVAQELNLTRFDD